MTTFSHVAHLTSAHPRYDTRIFHKMCVSLAEAGYHVSLVVADGNGDELNKGVSICDVGPKSGNRIQRMTSTVRQVLKKAKLLDADIYHLHDPELITIGLILKKSGKKVIFDAHEDLPKQILGKKYLSPVLRYFLAFFFIFFEKFTCNHFSAVIAATPQITAKFKKINKNTITINNYPHVEELISTRPWIERSNAIVFLGSIDEARGIRQLVSSLVYLDNVTLNLGGSFSEKESLDEIKSSQSADKINFLGNLNRVQVKDLFANSKIGMVTFLPAPNHMNAQPNKMFEYMSAGLPVIASNFDSWKKIIEGNKCGICVDPVDPMSISNAIQYLFDNPDEASRMGLNGKLAVQTQFNWRVEEEKLEGLYRELSL